MQLSLRKAAAIGKAIKEHMRLNPVAVLGSVNRFDEPKPQVDKLRAEMTTRINENLNLIEISFDLRTKAGAVNASCGIDDLLCEKGMLEGQIAVMTQIVSAGGKADSESTVQKKWDATNKRADATETHYNIVDAFNTGLIDEATSETMTKRLRDAKKRLRTISDLLLDANVKNSIEIDDDAEMTLQSIGLV